MDIEASQPKQERSRTRWTASLDRIFADLVVKQILLGNRPNNVFDKKTWNIIRDEFNKQTDLSFNNNQLRKHLDVLRARFYSLKSAYDKNDFAAMEDSCCIGFDLWEEIEAQPRPEPVKIKECPIYDQLCTIFTDLSADGKYAQSSHFEGVDRVVGNDTSSLTSCPYRGSIHTDNPSTSRLAQNNLFSEKLTTSIAERKRKRQSEAQPSLDQSIKEEEMSEAMAGAMLDMVAAWKSRRTIVTKQSESKFSITNCIKALDEIEDIEEWLYFAAVDLFEDPNLRETFISLKSSKIRLTWLRGKCKKPPTTSVQGFIAHLGCENWNNPSYLGIHEELKRKRMVFGYAYPAYECYKTVEMNKPEIDQLRFWCQYWILVAVLTVCERIGDTFISWVPMYSEAKLAFYIYLWYPKTRGTTYVYDSFFRPYVAKHENEIDRNLLELRTRAGDMAVLYWQRAASYGQTRIFEIMQYVSSQSTPRPHRAQNSQAQGARACQPSGVPNRQTSSKPQSAQSGAKQPSSPASSASSSQHQKEVAEDVGPSKVPSQLAKPPTRSVSLNSQKADTASETTSSQPVETEAEAMQTESLPPSPENEGTNPQPKETLMEESIRLTRGRLRKTRSAAQ
ncbi:hypothetical protein V6N13_082899 [Hibiscus sabdariffa]